MHDVAVFTAATGRRGSLRRRVQVRVRSRLASDLSTSNLEDYTFTADAAVFHNNAGASFTVINLPVPGDLDGDQDVDLDDYFNVPPCIGGPGVDVTKECNTEDFTLLDFDGDGDVDLADIAEFQLSFTGPSP